MVKDDELITPMKQWRKTKKGGKSRAILTRSREQSSESDQSKESDDEISSDSSSFSNSTIKPKQYIYPAKMPGNTTMQRKYRSRSLSKGRSDSRDQSYRAKSKGKAQRRREPIQDSVSQPKSRRESSESEAGSGEDQFLGNQSSKTTERKRVSKEGEKDDKKSKSGEKIKFNEVSVFFFPRAQGCVAIPRDGNFTIGMEGKHSIHHKWKIEDDNEVGGNKDKGYLEHDEQILAVPTNNKCLDSEESDDEITFNFKPLKDSYASTSKEQESRENKNSENKLKYFSQIFENKEEDIEIDKAGSKFVTGISTDLDNCLGKKSLPKVLSKAASESSLIPRKFNVSPVPDNEPIKKRKGECGTRGLTPLKNKQRISLLKDNGVTSIDRTEADEIRLIRDSRRRCGCSCVDICRPTTCECAINEIECQVENEGFPCACSKKCKNPSGRRTFNETEVQLHYIQTMLHNHL